MPTPTSFPTPSLSPGQPGWWRRAVIYQVYIRSFADSDGDGLGDVRGLRSRLPYLRDLGVDAIWITPWYRSPMADGGYDVADHRTVDPRLGSLADADALVAEAHAHGLRILLDLVPNHTSDRHPWFMAALRDGPGSAARARYLFRDGRGSDGDEPPNDWPSVFGGPAWQRVREADGRPGQWYLHIFAPEQPDLDWSSAEVRAEYEAILRFWFERGVDGFRIDVAHALVKAPGLPDLRPVARAGAQPGRQLGPGEHPHWDRPEVHAIHAAWRRVADACSRPGDERILVGEIGLPAERIVPYLAPGQLHGAFNFPVMRTPWDAAALRSAIEVTLSTHAAVGAAPSWVVGNHDQTRVVTRLGRPYSGIRDRDLDDVQASDLALGTRRARAAALLMLALPGSAYLYAGDELGLPEVEDLPESMLEDPIWERSGRTIRGRDGCRVPLPWSGDARPFGFGPPGSRPWLPQPDAWAALTAERQSADPGSMLILHREALRLRRVLPDLAGEDLRWTDAPSGVLRFRRGGHFECVVNPSDAAVPLPAGARVLLASAPLMGSALPPDTAAWLAPPPPRVFTGGNT